MERVLQLPPLRFGLPLVRSSPAGRVADGVLLVGGAGCRCAEEAGERAF
jgi:hypothetical protein